MINKMNKRAAGTRTFVINLAIVVFVIIMILSFAFSFLAIKNPNNPIIVQSHITGSLNAMNQSLTDLTNQSTQVFQQMGSSTPSPTDYLFLIFQGAFTIPKAFLGFAFTAILNIGALIFNGLGGGMLGGIVTLVVGLISAILTITLVLYIVNTIRTGNADHA